MGRKGQQREVAGRRQGHRSGAALGSHEPVRPHAGRCRRGEPAEPSSHIISAPIVPVGNRACDLATVTYDAREFADRGGPVAILPNARGAPESRPRKRLTMPRRSHRKRRCRHARSGPGWGLQRGDRHGMRRPIATTASPGPWGSRRAGSGPGAVGTRLKPEFDSFYASYGFSTAASGTIAAFGIDPDSMTSASITGPGHGPRWESKAGTWLRIQHGLDEMEGGSLYGDILGFYRRTGPMPADSQSATSGCKHSRRPRP